MNQSYIIPFMKSVQNVFETMLQLPVQINEPSLKAESTPSFDVSGIIGMSGDVSGTIVLSFPTATAERIVSIFTGMEMSSTHEDFADAVGELVNMVSGGAKAQFVDKNVSITCPSVVVGSSHQIHGQKDLTLVEIPCSSDCGEFSVEVGIRQTADVTV
ncbi:chemotaxis protein CheX [Poriferisphaera sp. WC338]|uniref:chemotaxis protein CheX n=1 Tax=Poriferisphaera sp. WC338 TaxID=3425129 RepID=UPI003D813177